MSVAKSGTFLFIDGHIPRFESDFFGFFECHEILETIMDDIKGFSVLLA